MPSAQYTRVASVVAWAKVPSSPGSVSDATALRRYFQREMLRIQARSICGPAPVFDTLGEMSDLADSVIATAYRLALEEVLRVWPPARPSYEPPGRMMVIASDSRWAVLVAVS